MKEKTKIITLEAKHFKGASYHSLALCPLLKAVRQQFPELKVQTVFADSFRDGEGNVYGFDCTDETGYSAASYKKIQKSKETREIRFWMERLNSN